MHIVSPSTIPLTLGEEMAVLVLPIKSLLALASDRNTENPESDNAPLRPVTQFLSTWTSNIETAAGVMPGIRAACPMVPGRTSPSF